MKRQSVCAVILMATLSVITSQADFAFAISQAVSQNSTAQVISSGTWAAYAEDASGNAPTGSAYTLTPSNTRTTCSSITSYTKTTTSGWSNSNSRVTLNNITSLVVGMTVSGTGIKNSGTNTISAIDVGNKRVTLSAYPNTSSTGTTLTFSTVPVCVSSYDKFFSVINSGSYDIATLTIANSVSTTSGNSIQLQSCNIGGAGTASAAWDEPNGTCAGTINVIMTTIGAGAGANSPQSISGYSLPISSGGSVRLRALSTQSGSSATVSIAVLNSDIRSSQDTNA